MSGRLLIHCGGYETTREEIVKVEAPKPTKTHYPINHSTMITEAEKLIQKVGYEIISEAHALSHEEQRYFGLYELQSTITEVTEYNPVVGIRNSHDKAYAAGLVCGQSVFVCDNLSFTGEFTFTRRHTRHGEMETLTGMADVFAQMPAFEHRMKERVDIYKETQIPRDISKFIITCAQRRIIAPNQVVPVWEEWEDPVDSFGNEGRNLWRLTNAFTSTMKYKGYNVYRNAPATLKLDDIVQEYFGIKDILNPPVTLEVEAEVIIEEEAM